MLMTTMDVDVDVAQDECDDDAEPFLAANERTNQVE